MYSEWTHTQEFQMHMYVFCMGLAHFLASWGDYIWVGNRAQWVCFVIAYCCSNSDACIRSHINAFN